ncbi:FtsW/RodA/SpoVE family cell cycle protein [Parabacteroides sp. 52]|uniref:FtsW/RodA/SpoVE family cell cycle protein n=1 Tax=Parabacteroides sp. 52 TaxID=2302940 RepID=UPI0013D89045|nr:FtsW/RodA/SpoVE family cell cycle protein [Parabacteroides sp. 52]NDV55503.1 FtsW/RodA/SpoVE family cell cycle protein [Parabacteroides sp. 52]
MDLASKLFRGDRVIWVIFMFLCLISVVEVFSATSTLTYKGTANHWGPIVRHATFLLGGFVLILLIHNVPYRFFPILILLLPVSIGMLILTPFIGIGANDAHRWMELFGIQFQPSEFAKLSLLVFVSFMLSKRSRFSEDQIFKYILIVAAVTCLLILPENFSTALMLFGIVFMLMFIGQVPFLKLLKLGGVLLLAGVLFIVLLRFTPEDVTKYLPDRFSTWQARMERFFEPQEAGVEQHAIPKITDDNYQVYHAKIAIARGGVFGKLPGHSLQRDFLPQAYSDFIYAIIIEELGMVGGLFVLLLYVMLLVRAGMIARRCEKPFAKYLVLGCGLVIVVQAFANMAVAVDLIPVTGQPLPLVSRGGTSTLITCIYFGVVLSISRFGAGMGNEEEERIEEETEQIEEDPQEGNEEAEAEELAVLLDVEEVETIEEEKI